MPIFKVAQIMCIFLFDAVGFASAAVAAAILLMENTFDGMQQPTKKRKRGRGEQTNAPKKSQHRSRLKQ